MSAAELLPPLRFSDDEVCVYTGAPRPRPFFRTVIDSRDVFAERGRTVVRSRSAGEDTVEIRVEHWLKRGSMVETCRLSSGASLRALSLSRTADDGEGECARAESVDFTRGPVTIPATAYPEVLLPFVMRGQPFDGKRRSLHAWINDRFIAKVYYQLERRSVRVDVPAGRFMAHEIVMYPDLNDWVPMGAVLTTLARPFLPKYHMWFDESAPHRVVRFEGPYGPPGAPEVLLELSAFHHA